METTSHRTPYTRKAWYTFDGLLHCVRRFARRCREADAMIRRL